MLQFCTWPTFLASYYERRAGPCHQLPDRVHRQRAPYADCASWKNITNTHYGDQLRAPLKSSVHHSSIIQRDLRRALISSPIMPKDASFSDSGCIFFLVWRFRMSKLPPPSPVVLLPRRNNNGNIHNQRNLLEANQILIGITRRKLPDLTPEGNPFNAKSIGEWYLHFKLGLIQQDSGNIPL